MTNVSRGAFAYLSIFLLALIVRVWYNFATPHIDAAFAFDAAEYLRDAQGFQKIATLPLDFWLTATASLFGPVDSPQAELIHRQLEPLKELCQAGPIFPLFILLCYRISGIQAVLVNTFPPVAAQCILTSLSCVFIALIGTILWDKRAGITAGLLAAFYPGFIVNSGRLYSESFATFLICAIFLLMSLAIVRKELSFRSSLLLGFLAALLHVTRSVMAAVSLALAPITLLIGGERRKEKLALYLVGFAVVLLPWLFIQKSAFGKASFVVDRVGHYNFFIGNNADTEGWLTFPYPEHGGVESQSFFRIWREGFQRSPERWFKLMLDKPARLLSAPWNDFKAPIGPFGLSSQILYHELLLLLAAIGVVTSLSESAKEPGSWRKVFARFGLLAFILFHLVYCGFITVPRYALPVVPCITLFAAAALTSMWRHPFSKALFQAVALLSVSVGVFLYIERCGFVIPVTKLAGESWLTALTAVQICLRLLFYAAVMFLSFQFARRLSVSQRAAAVSAFLLFLIAAPDVCLPLRVFGRWYEWAEPFNQPGETILQTIRLNDDQAKRMLIRQSYVVVNLENGAFLADDVQIRINGIALDTFSIPVMSFAENMESNVTLPNHTICPEVEYILNDITYFVGSFPLELRQWFLVPVSPNQLTSALALNERNQIAKGTLVISVEKLTNRANAFYGGFRTDPHFLLVPSLTQFSWEKGIYSLENDRGLSDFALDTKVSPSDSSPASARADGAPAHPYIRILVSPPVYGGPGLINLLADSSLPQLITSPTGISAATQSVEQRNSDGKGIKLVRFTSDLYAKPGGSRLSVGLIAELRKQDGTPLLYPSKWFPQIVSPCSVKTRLDYAFPIAPRCFDARLTGLTATLAGLEFFNNVKTPSRLSTKGREQSHEISLQSGLGQACFASDYDEHIHDAPSQGAGKIASGQLDGPARSPAVRLPSPDSFGSDVAGIEQNLRFRIYELPNNPLSAGHEIY
jgi:4-amino-4-deoxy-L-arabinose transferase-like glycosyltransferase